jgi:hypothetical protein
LQKYYIILHDIAKYYKIPRNTANYTAKKNVKRNLKKNFYLQHFIRFSDGANPS